MKMTQVETELAEAPGSTSLRDSLSKNLSYQPKTSIPMATRLELMQPEHNFTTFWPLSFQDELPMIAYELMIFHCFVDLFIPEWSGP